MKKLFLFLLVVAQLFAAKVDNNSLFKSKDYQKLPQKSKILVREFLHNFSIRQQQTIFWAYETGKIYDLSWSLMAIVWKESLGGLVKINLFDGKYGSCGIFMNNLETVAKDAKIKITKWNLNKICTRLIDKPEYSLKEAIKVLRHYQQKAPNNWRYIWAHYNGGYAHPNYKYAKEIWYRIQAFKFILKNYKKSKEVL